MRGLSNKGKSTSIAGYVVRDDIQKGILKSARYLLVFLGYHSTRVIW